MERTLTELQRTQRRFMNHAWTPPAFTPRSALTPMADYVHHSTLMACRALLPDDLSNSSILIVNCGSGVDTHFFCTEGARRVYVTDLAERTVALAGRHNPGVYGATAATERLPFRDGAFDYVGVRSGLHHLDDPFEGLREMARVARLGVFFIEGQKTPFVPLLVAAGFLEAKEESGNVVYRFTRDEIRRELHDMGFLRVDCVTGWFLQFPWLMRCAQSLGGEFSASALRSLVRFVNYFVGQWGNAMIVTGFKTP